MNAHFSPCHLNPQRKFRQADEDDSYFNDDDETELVFAPAATSEEKETLSEDVASLMDDVKHLDDK